jgi:hypothetical protein
VSRRDDERVADILDAADEVAEIVGLGRDAWDKERIRQLAVERLWRSSARQRTLSPKTSAHGTQAFPGATSSACGSCWRTITTGSIRARCG